MASRMGLFEYLGVEVPADLVDQSSTRATFTDTETFDDDPGGALDFLAHGSTVMTRVSGETYDDDPGIAGLGTPGQTALTHADGETYDDDPGIGGLGIW